MTKIGIEIRDRAKGGLFSIVDNTLKELSSLKLQTVEQLDSKNFDFLSDIEIEKEMIKHKTTGKK